MKVEKKMWEIRKKKLESLLKEQISILIQKGEIKDPRINSFVIVTGADITRDLKYAKIFISYSGNLRARENEVKVLKS
jgi:ribosome-binding factor A